MRTSFTRWHQNFIFGATLSVFLGLSTAGCGDDSAPQPNQDTVQAGDIAGEDGTTPPEDTADVDDATPPEDTTDVDDATPPEDTADVDDATPPEDTADVDDATPPEDTTDVDDATPPEDTADADDAADADDPNLPPRRPLSELTRFARTYNPFYEIFPFRTEELIVTHIHPRVNNRPGGFLVKSLTTDDAAFVRVTDTQFALPAPGDVVTLTALTGGTVDKNRAITSFTDFTIKSTGAYDIRALSTDLTPLTEYDWLDYDAAPVYVEGLLMGRAAAQGGAPSGFLYEDIYARTFNAYGHVEIRGPGNSNRPMRMRIPTFIADGLDYARNCNFKAYGTIWIYENPSNDRRVFEFVLLDSEDIEIHCEPATLLEGHGWASGTIYLGFNHIRYSTEWGPANIQITPHVEIHAIENYFDNPYLLLKTAPLDPGTTYTVTILGPPDDISDYTLDNKVVTFTAEVEQELLAALYCFETSGGDFTPNPTILAPGITTERPTADPAAMFEKSELSDHVSGNTHNKPALCPDGRNRAFTAKGWAKTSTPRYVDQHLSVLVKGPPGTYTLSFDAMRSANGPKKLQIVASPFSDDTYIATDLDVATEFGASPMHPGPGQRFSVTKTTRGSLEFYLHGYQATTVAGTLRFDNIVVTWQP